LFSPFSHFLLSPYSPAEKDTACSRVFFLVETGFPYGFFNVVWQAAALFFCLMLWRLRCGLTKGNLFYLLRVHCDKNKCVRRGTCLRACPTNVEIHRESRKLSHFLFARFRSVGICFFMVSLCYLSLPAHIYRAKVRFFTIIILSFFGSVCYTVVTAHKKYKKREKYRNSMHKSAKLLSFFLALLLLAP